jgi:hypothetical protein
VTQFLLIDSPEGLAEAQANAEPPAATTAKDRSARHRRGRVGGSFMCRMRPKWSSMDARSFGSRLLESAPFFIEQRLAERHDARELLQYIKYLKAGNRILRSKLPKRVDVTLAERAELIKLGGGLARRSKNSSRS